MLSAEALQMVVTTMPALRIDRIDDATVRVVNDVVGSSAELPRSILKVLDVFRSPRPLADGLQSGLDASCLELLPVALEHAFIIDADWLVQPLGAGAASLGVRSALSALLGQGSPGVDVVVVGTPYGSGATVHGQSGCQHGSAEIRRAFDPYRQMFVDFPVDPAHVTFADFDRRREYSRVARVRDIGNVQVRPGEGGTTYGARVAHVVGTIADMGAVPGLLGGDHSMTHYALGAMLERHESLGVLHFDAHDDNWPEMRPTFSYVTHGNMLYHARKSPRLKVLRQLGLRGVMWSSRTVRTSDDRVSYFSARELQRMTPDEAFAGLPVDIPYYVTIDIDCIDPTYAPETTTPQTGGLTYYQALDLIEFAARNFKIAGWDVTEVCEARSHLNGAAMCAAGLIEQLLMAGIAHEPWTEFVPRPD